MIRTPLRPLARILKARESGENPDAIERANKRKRHEEMRDQSRRRAEGSLVVLGLFFLTAFGAVGGRMATLSASDVAEPRSSAMNVQIRSNRADILDRRGRILATNHDTYSLYAHPHKMIDKDGTIAKLLKIFPDLNEQKIRKELGGNRKFAWVKKRLSPEQKQAAHDIGDPGLLFGPREMRLYPNGAIAAHILGGTRFGEQGVSSAEVLGVAGVEKFFDNRLRDPAKANEPLELSLDLTVQATSEEVLFNGMKIMNAKGASSVLMDANTGEVISVVSLPDFDPNNRPRPLTVSDKDKDQSDSPLFNRALQGVYELGSTFKIFTAAQAVDLGIADAETIIDTKGPMRVGGRSIGEFENKSYGKLSVSDIMVKSSNRGTGRLALEIGAERQQEFLKSLGFFKAAPVETVERGTPLLPSNWTELSTVTISYGHGLSSSPMQLAAGYAAIANGGTAVTPTLLKQEGTLQLGPRVMSPGAAREAQKMLRAVVTDGTASFGNVPGYSVAGKTGTADKPKPTGGYYEDRVIATFATMFPSHDPKYVLIVTLDEPEIMGLGRMRRSAGWTAVPVTAEMIRRVAPLLDLRPTFEPASLARVTLTSH